MFSKIGVLKTLVLGSLSGEGFANFLQNFRTATIEIFFRGGGIEERGGGKGVVSEIKNKRREGCANSRFYFFQCICYLLSHGTIFLYKFA